LRVLVVQDHPLLATALARILETGADVTVCGIASTGVEAAAAAVRERADVILMDFYLPDMSGTDAAANIRTGIPTIAIVFHSAEESESALLDAIDAGATAYLTKTASADQIVEAVRQAGQGEVIIPVELFAKAIARQRTELARQQDRDRFNTRFTLRERDVLKLLAEGMDTPAMADRLGIATHTVQWHVRHVIEKLGVHSKLQAVIAAARIGLIDLPKP
jgi:two-component system, NarL family, nitrate/nitrite response regulator NarL